MKPQICNIFLHMYGAYRLSDLILLVLLHCFVNMLTGGKLASLEEFKVQKEDLMAKMAQLEVDLKDQESVHNDEIYKLERKQVVDKDRCVYLLCCFTEV